MEALKNNDTLACHFQNPPHIAKWICQQIDAVQLAIEYIIYHIIEHGVMKIKYLASNYTTKGNESIL